MEAQGPFGDDDLILVSAVEHYSYCPRQFGLIHLEQLYEENVLTLQGSRIHRRVDEEHTTWEEGKRIERAVPLWSEKWGLVGKADAVEFHPDGKVVPVEYKRGGRRALRHDALQLCAQAFCLEEMLQRPVEQGALYYHSSRRRREVALDTSLRRDTARAIAEMRDLLHSGRLPPPVNDARCPNCSLIAACCPEMMQAAGRPRPEDLYRIPREEEVP